MKRALIPIFIILGSSFVFGKLVDIHIPSKEELHMEHERERNKENNKAFDIIRDKDCSQEDRERAYNTLLDNGVMS